MTTTRDFTRDTATPEAAIAAVYEAISGAAGVPRDWERFRHVMHPRHVALRTVIDTDGTLRAEVFDVASYIANVTPFFAANDFHEVECPLFFGYSKPSMRRGASRRSR